MKVATLNDNNNNNNDNNDNNNNDNNTNIVVAAPWIAQVSASIMK